MFKNSRGCQSTPSTHSTFLPVKAGSSAGELAKQGALKEFPESANQRKITILRLKQLQARIGLGRSAIYYLMDPNCSLYDEEFPRSVKLSSQAVGWIESEIDDWIESRITASRAQNSQRNRG